MDDPDAGVDMWDAGCDEEECCDVEGPFDEGPPLPPCDDVSTRAGVPGGSASAMTEARPGPSPAAPPDRPDSSVKIS